MSKLDELMKASRGIASESMGRPPVATAMHRASAPAAAPMPDRLQGIARSKNAAEIPLDKIDRDPDQPREEFEPGALGRLAESIRARGQLQPIRVRWDEGRSLYIIVCGERRWRAARMAGATTMSCVIMEGSISSAELLSLQLVENLVREDLKPIEQAKGFRAVMDLNGWSTHDVARELAVDQSSVVRALKLLDLPAAIQDQVEQGTLSPATAYEVSKLEDPDEQVALAARVVDEGLSRAETVQAVRRASVRPAKGKGRGVRKPTTHVFRRVAGCTVTVENGRGLDQALTRAALAEAIARLDAEAEPDGQAA
jgi:ParB family transcriptional regulator, chromosome partitioning protein